MGVDAHSIALGQGLKKEEGSAGTWTGAEEEGEEDEEDHDETEEDSGGGAEIDTRGRACTPIYRKELRLARGGLHHLGDDLKSFADYGFAHRVGHSDAFVPVFPVWVVIAEKEMLSGNDEDLSQL